MLHKLLSGIQSIAEICCGDCSLQQQLYTQQLGIRRFCGLDIEPGIVALNRELGVECICGNALDEKTMQALHSFGARG